MQFARLVCFVSFAFDFARLVDEHLARLCEAAAGAGDVDFAVAIPHALAAREDGGTLVVPPFPQVVFRAVDFLKVHPLNIDGLTNGEHRLARSRPVACIAGTVAFDNQRLQFSSSAEIAR